MSTGTIDEAACLDGQPGLPGFQLPLRDLFSELDRRRAGTGRASSQTARSASGCRPAERAVDGWPRSQTGLEPPPT